MKNDCLNCKHNQGQTKHEDGSITTDCALTDCVAYPLKSRCKAWLELEKDEQGYYIRHHAEIKENHNGSNKKDRT